MDEVMVHAVLPDGSIVISGPDPDTKRPVSGGFYNQSHSDKATLALFTRDGNGDLVRAHLHLSFEVVETLRNQLDVWMSNHWPQDA